MLSAARSYTSALEHVDEVLTSEPENVGALLVRAGLGSVNNDLDAMLADLDAVLVIEPENEAALAMKAQALVRQEDSAGGEEYWRKLLAVSPSSGNYIVLARFLAGLERGDEALEVARQAIDAAENEEERVTAQMNLANLHLNAGDRPSTLQVLERAREQSPGNAQIVLALARIHFATGDPERAEALLREHVDQQPDNAEPLLVLADYYRASDQQERAIEAVDRALAIEPGSESAQLRRAEYLHVVGDEASRKEAWEIVEGVLARNPASVAGHFTEGKFHLAEANYEAAATSLRRVLDKQASANAHVLLGEAYQRLEQPDLARREFQRALQLEAQNAQARISLAALYLQTGESSLAEREARIVVEARPGDARARLLLAGALLQQQRPEQARETLEAIGKGEGLTPTVRLDLARTLRQSGDVAGARQILRELLEQPELRVRVQTGLVDVDLLEGNVSQAMARLDEWISEEPDEAELYLLRGRVRLMRADADLELGQAEADLKAAIEKGLPGVQAHLLLSGLYMRTGATDAALETVRAASELSPLDPRIPFQLAAIYERLGRTDEAREAYESVLRLDQDHAVVKNNLAWLLASSAKPSDEDLERATQLAQDAHRELPDNPSAADTLGWVMLKKNIPTAATPLFQEALAGLPDPHPLRATVRYHLAQAYERNGETDRAIAEYLRVLALEQQNAQARLSLAALYLRTGENQLAGQEARAAVEGLPGDARPRLVLAGALIRQERLEQAREALEPLGQGTQFPPATRLDLARAQRQAGDPESSRLILSDLLGDLALRTRAQTGLVDSDLLEGKPEQALARLDGWILDEPEEAELYLLRGRVRLGLISNGDSAQAAEAEADLEVAIDKGLPGVQAQLLLSSLYLRTGATEAALQTLEAARRRSPEDPRVPFQQAIIYERVGRADEARQAYEAVLRLNQDQPVVKNNLAWLLASAEEPSPEDLDRAVELAREAEKALPSNPSVLDTLGWVMLKKDIPSAAISLFNEALASLPATQPLRGTVRYHLAQAYERNGETDRAIAELTRALDEVPGFGEREATEEMLRELRSS